MGVKPAQQTRAELAQLYGVKQHCSRGQGGAWVAFCRQANYLDKS
jgi:hypothetical protein